MVFKPNVVLFQIDLAKCLPMHKTYDAKPMDLLEFCHQITCHYLETYGNPAEFGMRGKPSGKCNIDSCYEGMNHTIIKQIHCTQCQKTLHFNVKNVTLHYM
ncbi:chimeric ERCC6-PGBD3 protein [Trichonephila clavata]|uniref:Chimeric ERCC6-PGBD3 protein n=1 Tax=Trichonephila clavata TaxID=2740835 RepID=A0A8X6LI95_TRICU|nr:chimeric ERCC6-PGBD3 protein [Trichonephila clavata]